MQTILGSNGIIGRELAKILVAYTDRIRLVSRNPKKVNPENEIFPADLLDAEAVMEAVKGSEVVYLTAGLIYNIKIWQAQWPVIMKNVIDACIRHQARLVFFDNVYVYGRVNGWMTEETPMNPVSKKGEVRMKLAGMIMNEIRKGTLKAIIARSADFYGPDTPLSFINVMVFDNLKKGKKPQWMINDNVKHSLTYTPDAARATAILGNTESAFNQVWHLPTDRNALTGREFIELAAKAAGIKPKHQTIPKLILRIIGMFNGVVRESLEMLYQNDSEYLFDSSKYEEAFGFKPTTYEEGIIATVRASMDNALEFLNN
jgi:nucleoside-diphosphate-sugar epimerase